MKKRQLLLFALLAIPLALFATPIYAANEQTFTLNQSIAQFRYTLPANTTFNASISTTGAVRVWLTEPNGTAIINSGIIEKDTTFSFVAKQNGTYTLNFENDVASPIQVTFSYQTNPPLEGDNNNSVDALLSLLPILVVITVVGSVLIVLFIHRRNSRKTPII